MNIVGTTVSNIEPNRNKTNVKTISGISNWQEWKWSDNNNSEKCIFARSLPHIGNWNEISPEKISRLMKEPLKKPQPVHTEHTTPKNEWTTPSIKESEDS
jgi:hypothetical protein